MLTSKQDDPMTVVGYCQSKGSTSGAKLASLCGSLQEIM